MRLDYFDVTRRTTKLYSQAVEPVCSRWELTRNELDVLLFLYNNPEYDRASDVVAHRGMTKSHVSLSVSALEERDLLLCVPDAGDRRVVRLKLTKTAKEIAQQGREAQKSFFAELFAGLAQEDLEFWQSILERVCANVAVMESK